MNFHKTYVLHTKLSETRHEVDTTYTFLISMESFIQIRFYLENAFSTFLRNVGYLPT
jgi:hypothetical protein